MGLRLAPVDVSWSTVVISVGEGERRSFVTIEAPSRDLLAWTIGRSRGETHWPALTPWQGIP
jgi:hypothetical protein